jgi:hypothetical protein
MGQTIVIPTMPRPDPADIPHPRDRALELAGQAASERDPDRRRLLEQAALYAWQEARRGAL